MSSRAVPAAGVIRARRGEKNFLFSIREENVVFIFMNDRTFRHGSLLARAVKILPVC